jgi:hypothetical protein
MDCDDTIDDRTLRASTGLHVDSVRRLVTDKLLTPLETQRGRGQMRRWSRSDFRRAALVAVFMHAGFSARWSTPIVNEFTDAMLDRAARALLGDYQIAIYQRVFTFFEAPPACVRAVMADGIDCGWRNNRLLIAAYQGDPPTWRGFDNTVFLPEHLHLDGLSAEAETNLRAARQGLRDLAETGHARAEDCEHVLKINASRVIGRAEERAGLTKGKET